MLTAPAEEKASDPKLVASAALSPSVIDEPDAAEKRALFPTLRVVPAASVMEPADVRLRMPAALVPVSTVAESSTIRTELDTWKVSDPKLVVSAALSPSVMPDRNVRAENSALFVTVRFVPGASVMEPADERLRLLTVLVPVSTVAEPSTMLTAPVELKVSDPKLVVSNALSPSVIDEPENSALFVTVRLVPAASVIDPPTVTARESKAAAAVPAKTTLSEPA